jgi:hypothetical protein
MLTLAIGLILGLAVNRWWVVVFPIAFGLIVGSAINALAIVTVAQIVVLAGEWPARSP